MMPAMKLNTPPVTSSQPPHRTVLAWGSDPPGTPRGPARLPIPPSLAWPASRQAPTRVLPDEREVLEVEVRQRLADLAGRVPGDLVAVGVEHVDVGRDDVAALVEVELLHLPQDLPAHRRAGRRVRLVVEA